MNTDIRLMQRTRKYRPWRESMCTRLEGFKPLVHGDLPANAAWVIFAVVLANMLAYVVAFSNAVIISDAWYFLDVFVKKALHGTLELSDFFVKRGGLDHAQPLRKLILLFDLRYFELDFRIQAVIGLACAAGSILLLRYIVFWHDTTGRNMRSWIWSGMCVALLSLNSTGVWTWPLVASGFTSYVFLLALLVALWKQIDTGTILLVIPAALMFDFVADDVAIIANIACVLALTLLAWKAPSQYLRRALQAISVLVISLIVVRTSYALIYTPPSVQMAGFVTQLRTLSSDFLHNGWWQWPLIPLSSSIAYIEPLRMIFEKNAFRIQIFIGIVLLVCHIWFWRRAFRASPNAATFSAVTLMLFFYGLLAGIIYTRVPTFGNDYLNQPRYVLVYDFSTLALLLMCSSCDWSKTVYSKFRIPMIICATGLLVWQIPISYYAWRKGPYIAVYEQRLSDQIWEMAENDYKVPSKCLPELAVCQDTRSKRAELIGMLQTYQLNVFSKRFQRSTRIRPPLHPTNQASSASIH